jgi:putative peptidoglycan lipid II flippase
MSRPVHVAGSATGRRKHFASAILGTTLGNALGAILPFFIAAWYVAGATTDAYFYALGTILFLNAMVALSVEASTTPHVVALKDSGCHTVRRFVVRVIAEASTLVAVLTALTTAVMIVLIIPRTGFHIDQQRAVVTTLLILTPLPVLVTANSVLAGAQYGYQHFLLPTTSNALRSAFAIALGLSLRDSVGINAVAYGLVLGEGLRFVLLWSSFARVLDRFRASRQDAEPSIRTSAFWHTVIPQVVSVSLGALGQVVDKTVASTLVIGSVTIVELTQRMVFTPLLLLASGIGLVLGSTWAEMIEGRREGDVVQDFIKAQVRVGLLASAIAAAAIATVWAGRSLFKSAIGLDDPRLVALTFTLIAVGIPFALISQVAVRLLIAARQTSWFPLMAAGTLAVNVVLDLSFVQILGVAGIALASACANVFNAAAYNLLVLRVVRGKRLNRLLVPERVGV